MHLCNWTSVDYVRGGVIFAQFSVVSRASLEVKGKNGVIHAVQIFRERTLFKRARGVVLSAGPVSRNLARLFLVDFERHDSLGLEPWEFLDFYDISRATKGANGSDLLLI